MEAIIEYFVQSSVILALFYIIYFLLLRNERFFTEIRGFLLLSLCTAILLPFIKIPYTVLVEAVENTVIAGDLSFVSGSVEPVIKQESFFTLSTIVFLIYLLVASILFIRSLIKVGQIYRMISGKQYTVIDNFKIVLLGQSIPAFTFFGYIVINREEFNNESRQNILAHEKVHAQQKHWIDLLLVELMTIIFWFNPFVWLFQLALKQTHELLADDGVIAHGYNIGQYQALLINQLMGAEVVGLANNFNYSINKKRMIMMSKDKSPKNRRYKLLMMFPVIVAVVIFNLRIEEVHAKEATVAEVHKQETVKITGVVLANDDKPIPGATVLVEGTSIGTVTNFNGEFELSIVKSANINVSFIALETKKISVEDFVLNGKKTDKGYFLKIKLKAENEQPLAEDDVHVLVDEKPVFPGGDLAMRKHIARTVKYPREAQKKGIEGKVLVTFVINKLGEVEKARVMRSVCPSIDKEAIRIVSTLPKWIPGKMDGSPVNVSYTIPLSFGLQNGQGMIVVGEAGKSKKQYKGEDIYVIVEQMPKFPEGHDKVQKYLEKEINKLDSKFKIGKRCFVSFVITKEGKIDNIRMTRSTGNAEVDAKAMEIVKGFPIWEPGIEGGKAVHMAYTLPITFKSL